MTNTDQMPKYWGFSVTLHLAMLLATLMIVVPKPDIRPIEIEVLSEPLKLSEYKSASSAQNEMAIAAEEPEEILEKAAPKEAPAKAASAVAQSLPQKQAAKAVAKAPVAEVMAVAKSYDTPVVNEDLDLPAVNVNDELSDSEMDEKLTQVDLNSNQENDFKVKLQNIDAEQESLDKKIAAAQVRVENDKKAIAESIERQRAAQLAAAAQRAAEQSALAENSKGTSLADAEEGEAGPVRSLSELKQRPGNPKPTYSEEDRFKRREGLVVFWAYINKTGAPQNFKIVQSSGHRSLDLRTFGALKQWKFEPGQQGWVELPYQWNLKGGPVEMPGQLRRKYSKN